MHSMIGMEPHVALEAGLKIRHPNLRSKAEKEVLRLLYWAMLKDLDAFEFELLPTEENATVMTNTIFLPAVSEGDPVLLAFVDNEPAGAIFWVRNRQQLDLRFRSALGYGTYVVEKYRRFGIGGKLRKAAIAILKELGVDTVLGGEQISNIAGVKSAEKAGFKQFARCDRLSI